MLSSRFALAARLSRRRPLHTSPALLATGTKGQALQAARQPIEKTHADQNPHLKHARGGAEDGGQGNAARDPVLPSHQLAKSVPEKTRPSQEKSRAGSRGLHTTARVGGEEKHTADSYSKEVDTSPAESKTHRVDGGAGQVQRPYENVSHEEPYTPPAEKKEQKKEEHLGYGGTKQNANEDTSGPGQGPEGTEAGGRKPE